MNELEPIFDTAELDEDDPMFSEVFRKALNNFSDETEGVPILESCLMKAKQYSYTSMMGMRIRSIGGSGKAGAEKMKGKGCPENVLKAAATHEHYKSCILGSSQDNLLQHVELDSIDAHQHQIYTVRKKRIMLSNVDNKRFGLDTVHSLPYGFKEEWIPPLDQSPFVREQFLAETDSYEVSWNVLKR